MQYYFASIFSDFRSNNKIPTAMKLVRYITTQTVEFCGKEFVRGYFSENGRIQWTDVLFNPISQPDCIILEKEYREFSKSPSYKEEIQAIKEKNRK